MPNTYSSIYADYSPSIAEVGQLTLEDIFGNDKLKTKGMVVATRGERCPIFKDIVPYKSVTAVCNTSQEKEVTNLLDYVMGGRSISKRKEIKSVGIIILRSDYQCWG